MRHRKQDGNVRKMHSVCQFSEKIVCANFASFKYRYSILSLEGYQGVARSTSPFGAILHESRSGGALLRELGDEAKMTLYFAFTHGLEIWNEKNVGLQELRFNAHYCPCRH
jgi:hypothetical protein